MLDSVEEESNLSDDAIDYILGFVDVLSGPIVVVGIGHIERKREKEAREISSLASLQHLLNQSDGSDSFHRIISTLKWLTRPVCATKVSNPKKKKKKMTF